MKIYMYSLALALSAASAGAQTIGCTKPGVFVGPVRGDMARAFSRMQVDSAFKGIVLSAEQQQQAEDIVRTAKVSSPGVATASDERHAKVMTDRNERLRALVPDGDRAKVTANIDAMARSQNRCDVSR